MKNINHNHPYWANHLKDLIYERWEKRNQQLCHSFVVDHPRGKSEEDVYQEARKRLHEYLVKHAEQIDDFSIYSKYDDNFNLVVEVRMAVKLYSPTA